MGKETVKRIVKNRQKNKKENEAKEEMNKQATSSWAWSNLSRPSLKKHKRRKELSEDLVDREVKPLYRPAGERVSQEKEL